MFFGTCGLFSPRPRGRFEDCSFFQMMYGFPSDSSSAVIVWHVALQALKLVRHSLGCSLFVAFSVSRFFPAAHLAAVVYLMCAPTLRFFCFLAQQPVVLQRRYTLFVCFVCCNIISTLCTGVPSRPMVSTTTCRHPAHLVVHLDVHADPLFFLHLPARRTHERLHGDTHRLLQRLKNFNNLVDGLPWPFWLKAFGIFF